MFKNPLIGLALGLGGCGLAYLSSPDSPEEPVVDPGPKTWLDGKMVLAELNMAGDATEVSDTITASVHVNLERVATCLGATAQACGSATVHWEREYPLHSDGMHRSDDKIRIGNIGLAGTDALKCLDPVRQDWKWDGSAKALPPQFGFSFRVVFTPTPERLAQCSTTIAHYKLDVVSSNGKDTAPNLCQEGENVLFACEVEGGKRVSLCASADLGPLQGTAQYRFGTPKNLELSYPPAPSGLSHFKCGEQPHATSLSYLCAFQSGQITYSVIDQVTMGSERDHFAGVTMEQDGKQVAVLPCKGVATLNVQALAETLKNL